MKYILFTIFLIGCISDGGLLSPEEYYELCPYELKFGRSHRLQVPVTMTPHQMTYRVGDTLTVSMHFSDWIHDLSRETDFKIENFPFEPATLVYKVQADSSTWDSGYYLNGLLVEDKYQPRYNGQSNRAADMRGFTIYEDGYYHFEYKLVFAAPGRYVTVITDQLEVNIGNEELNDLANAIEFEGKCPQSAFAISTTIVGDPHYEEFIDELLFLDKEVHYDNWSSLNTDTQSALGNGSSVIEWIGVYCFEVVE